MAAPRDFSSFLDGDASITDLVKPADVANPQAPKARDFTDFLDGNKPIDTFTKPAAEPATVDNFDYGGQQEQNRAIADWSNNDTNGALPDPNKPRTAWSELGAAWAKTTGAWIRQVGAGAVQAGGELDPYGDSLQNMGPASRALAEKYGAAADPGALSPELADKGKQLYAAADKDIKDAAPNVPQYSTQDEVFKLINVFTQMVPTIAAAVVSKNPTAGLQLMGAQVGYQQYGSARAEGQTPQEAAGEASFYTAAETLTELPFLEHVIKIGGKSFAPELLKSMGFEAFGEAVNQAVEQAYEAKKQVMKTGMSFADAWDQQGGWAPVIEAGALGAGAGGLIHTGVHGFNKLVRADEGGTPGGGSNGAPPGGANSLEAEQNLRAPLTPEEANSGIDPDLLSHGKAIVEAALTEEDHNIRLDANGLPNVGTRVNVDFGDGRVAPGEIGGTFEAHSAQLNQTATGITIHMDSGQKIEELLDTLKRAGVTITPELQQQAVDAQQAADSEGVQTGGDVLPATSEQTAPPATADSSPTAPEGAVTSEPATEPAGAQTAPAGQTETGPAQETRPAQAALIQQVHEAADKAGIPYDGDKAFMAWSKDLTGKEHLDEMNPADLNKILTAIANREGPPEPAKASEKEIGTKETEPAKAEPSPTFVQQLATNFEGKGFNPEVAKKNAGNLANVLIGNGYHDIVHPDNEKSRRIFHEVSGTKLPAGLAATKAALPVGKNHMSFLETKKAAAPEKTAASFKSSDWTEIGTNAEGHKVYEDQRGVRSYVEGGVRVTESVAINPRGGFSVKAPGEKGRDYEVVEPKPVSTSSPSNEAAKSDTPAKPAERPKGYGESNTLVTKDRADELRARLRQKFKSQLSSNPAYDPEILAMTTELAAHHIEAGARKLVDVTRALMEDLGVSLAQLKPYLRAVYNGARDMTEDAGRSIEGTDAPDEVKAAIAAMEAEHARTAKVGGPSEKPLEGVPADQVRGPAKGGNTGQGSSRGGGADTAGSGNADEGKRPQSPRSVPGSEGKIPVPAGGAEPAGGTDTEQPGVRVGQPGGGVGPRPGQPGTVVQPPNSYVITASDHLGEGGEVGKYNDNIAAIRLIKTLEDENRQATPEEQAQLVRYVGWGGLASAFPDGQGKFKAGWDKRNAELKSLLSEPDKPKAPPPETPPGVQKDMFGGPDITNNEQVLREKVLNEITAMTDDGLEEQEQIDHAANMIESASNRDQQKQFEIWARVLQQLGGPTVEETRATYEKEAPAETVIPKTAGPESRAFAQEPGDMGDRYATARAVNATTNMVYDRLRRELDLMHLQDVKLAVAKNARVNRDEAGKVTGQTTGLFDPNDTTIYVAVMGATDFERNHVFGHEALHAFVNLNLIKPEEWKILSDADRLYGWQETYRIGERYEGFTAEQQREEAIAEAFGHYYVGDKPIDMALGPERSITTRLALFRTVRTIAKRIMDFVEAVRNWSHGLGYKTAEDVFEALKNGQIGARVRGETRNTYGKNPIKESRDLVTPSVTFDNAETEERFQKARSGVKGPSDWLEKFKARAQQVKNGFTRHWIHLPNESRFYDVSQQLRKLEAAPQASKEQIVRVLQDLTKGMTAADLELFTRKVILDDLTWEVANDHAIAFGMTPEDVHRELAKVDAALANRPDLVDKVRNRKLINSQVAQDLVDRDVLSADQIKNPGYYRHVVLEYALAEVAAARGTGSQVRTPYWARRMGSTMDINANLLEAEFDWLHKAYMDIKAADTLQWIKDSTLNVRSETIANARDHNNAQVQQRLDIDKATNGFMRGATLTSPMNEEWIDFKRRIAIGLKRIKDEIEGGGVTNVPTVYERTMQSLTEDNANDDGSLFHFLSWMIDNQKPGWEGAAMVFKAISSRRAWTQNLLGSRFANTRDMNNLIKLGLAPEGHVAWQPNAPDANGKALILFTSKTVSEHAVERVTNALVADIPLPPSARHEVAEAFKSQVREALTVGGPQYQMVLPQELADTLSNFRDKHAEGLFDTLAAVPQTWWKRWTILNPRRALKYNINNLSGDLDAVVAGNPSALKRFPEALKELYSVMYKGEAPSQKYRDAVERGVFASGLSIQEIPDINVLGEFSHLLDKRTFAEAPAASTLELVMKAWRGMETATQFRENWLRYAAYLDYADRLSAGESMDSIGYGAALPEMVDAVTDTKDRAALLARELLGDYGNVSAFGREIRRKVIPFYSWMEINTKRYWRLIGNAYGEGVGRGLATTGMLGATMGARRTLWLGARMAMISAMIMMWNHLLFGDDEDKLDDIDRTQLHINLGQWGGQIHTLRFQGAFSDFLGWIGFPDVVATMADVARGRASVGEMLKTIAAAPIKKLTTSLTPLLTVPLEAIGGKKYFPDVFNPRTIRDRWRNFAAAFNLENEYDLATGAPTRGYAQSAEDALFYSKDVGEISYNKVRGLVFDWLERNKGVEGRSADVTPRSTALYEWKLAQKYGDKVAERKAYEKMRSLGMDAQSRSASIKSAAPLAPLPIMDRGKFKRTLTPKELEALDDATRWYHETFHRGAPRDGE